MKKDKPFDAVEMKNAIQARHQAERAGMSDEQVREAIAQRVNTSAHPVAQKWRRLLPDQRRPMPSNA